MTDRESSFPRLSREGAINSAFNIPAGNLKAIARWRQILLGYDWQPGWTTSAACLAVADEILASFTTPLVDAVPGEPVAWMAPDAAIFSKSREMLAYCQGGEPVPLYLATPMASRAVVAEPQPVAWRWRYDSAKRWVLTETPMSPADEYEVQPLYAIAPAATAEPSQVELTDSRIDAICAPGRAARWKGDGRQYDRDTVRLVLSAFPDRAGVASLVASEESDGRLGTLDQLP